MASTGAELGATVNAIFCCKETLKKGLMSGAVGTLQKEGYTEEKRAKIAHALNKSMWMFETNHAYAHQDGIDDEIGRIIYLGVFILLQRFGGSTDANIAVIKQVHSEFRAMELDTIEHTLGMVNTEHTPTDNNDQQEAYQSAQDIIAQLGGPFS